MPRTVAAKRATVLAIVILSLAARVAVRDFTSIDAKAWVTTWFDYLNDHGAAALGGELPNDEGFEEVEGNYPPSYYYLLYLTTWFDGWLPRLYLVKLISVCFDIVAALFTFGIVRRVSGSASRASTAAALTFAAPTLILNGALWAQCDAIHTSLMLGSVYFSIAGRPLATMVALGVALSFKAQAVFLVPYVLMLTMGGRIRYRDWAILPLTYAVMMTPAVLLGREYSELFLVYVRQGRFFHQLSMMSPNLYYFIPNTYYQPGVWVGIAVTIIASLAFALAPRRNVNALSRGVLVLAATTSVAMAPFLLPKMHDRYFLPADLLSIVLAGCVQRLWPVAVGFQVSSTLAYIPIITNALNNYEGGFEKLMPVAVIINTVLVLMLVTAYLRGVRGPQSRDSQQDRDASDAVLPEPSTGIGRG